VNRERMNQRMAYLFAAFGIYLVDQVSKIWAVATRPCIEKVTLVSGVLDLSYAENPGIAFGQLQEGGAFWRWFFVALAIAAAIAVLVYFFRSTRNDGRILIACAFLLAGIAGNLTDRARLGHVIDFILLHYRSFQWPVFNVADMSICAGAFLLIYDMFRKDRIQNPESRIQNAEVRNQKNLREPVAGTQESK
jgi:signal peptidase II